MSKIDHVVGDFVDRIVQLDDLKDLTAAYQHTVGALGFGYFTYHIVKVLGVGDRLLYIDTTYPDEWVKRYTDQNYVQLDPVVDEGPRSKIPFEWSKVADPKRLNPTQRAFFKEAADFGIANGVTVPIHGHRSFAMMSMVADGTTKESARNIAEHRHLVQMLTLYFHNHAGGMLLESYLEKDRPKLTNREVECLTWTARGKTSWEISMILSVSESTVIAHIENAKKKLGVTNKPHAVVKAVMMGLLDPAE
jgi:LuxR family transcriptional regulator, activator of conjugal transfer of Ti plasmids